MAAPPIGDVIKRLREIEDEFKVKLAALKAEYGPKIDVIERYLQKYLIDSKQNTVATDFGTVTTYERRNVKMTNLEELEAWCEANEKPEFMVTSVDSTEVLAYLDRQKGNQLPDGLKLDRTRVLSVKGPKE